MKFICQYNNYYGREAINKFFSTWFIFLDKIPFVSMFLKLKYLSKNDSMNLERGREHYFWKYTKKWQANIEIKITGKIHNVKILLKPNLNQTCINSYGEMVDFGESDKMIKIRGKADKSNTYNGFSSNISFFIQGRT